MNANELRIGNYLQNNNIKYPIRIGTISSNDTIKLDFGICKNVFIDVMNLCAFQGIKITQKWLNDFGFFIIETNDCVEAFKPNLRFSLQQINNCNQWFWCDGQTVITNFKYIHELQNLYFSLTGEELVVSDAVSQHLAQRYLAWRGCEFWNYNFST